MYDHVFYLCIDLTSIRLECVKKSTLNFSSKVDNRRRLSMCHSVSSSPSLDTESSYSNPLVKPSELW